MCGGKNTVVVKNMNNELGQYIYELRIRAGYSQTRLAELADVTPYYISYLESGRKSNPSITVMAKLFRELNMSKTEIEKFLDIHAKLNGCVSYDIADFIMDNDEVRKAIRSERDKFDSFPYWNAFIAKINGSDFR